MIIKKIFSLAASIISLFIIIFCFSYSSFAQDNITKRYLKDEGILSIMYHRFNESKYPSTNIQMDVFKKHINIVKESNFNYSQPANPKNNFNHH